MFAKVVSQSCILKLSQKQRRHLELLEIQSHHVCQRVLLWLVVCTLRLGENTHWRCLIPLFVFFYPNYLKIHVWWRVFWWLVVCSLGQKREGLPWIHIRQQVSTCACTNQPFYPPVGASCTITCLYFNRPAEHTMTLPKSREGKNHKLWVNVVIFLKMRDFLCALVRILQQCFGMLWYTTVGCRAKVKKERESAWSWLGHWQKYFTFNIF